MKSKLLSKILSPILRLPATIDSQGYIKCPHCNYSWHTNIKKISENEKIQCSNCQGKIIINMVTKK